MFLQGNILEICIINQSITEINDNYEYNLYSLMKFLKLILLFLSAFVFSQSKINEGQFLLSPRIVELSKQTNFLNLSETYEHGLKMLEYANTDYDKIWVYRFLGDVRDKEANYLEAIKLYEKAEIFAEKNKYYGEIFMINFQITHSYRQAGLKNQSLKSWKKVLNVKDFVDKTEADFFINQNYALQSEFDNDFCSAILFREKNVYTQEAIYNVKKDEKNYIDLLSHNIGLAYDNIKCGNITVGKKMVLKVEDFLKNLDVLDKFYRLDAYYLCKALLSEDEKKHSEAKFWFSLAYNTARIKNNNRSIKMIIDDSLLYNFKVENTKNDEDIVLKTYKELNEKRIKESSKIIDYELEKKDRKLETKQNTIILISLITCFLLILIFVLIYYYQKNKKKTQREFNKLIQKLKNETIIIDEQKNTITSSEIDNNTAYISEEKENELLKKLNDFEKGKRYTSKSFTIANLSTILKTNPKYLNYVISKHKNRNFNDYINHLRIQFITKQLYENKEYRQYKISYLSEISGFSNHSHFTMVFRKEQNMSPSEFIQLLNKGNIN